MEAKIVRVIPGAKPNSKGKVIPPPSSWLKTPILTPKNTRVPPPGWVVHSQISSENKHRATKSILNVNRVQTNIRTEVVQILGRNPMKTLIKRPFLALFAVTIKPIGK